MKLDSNELRTYIDVKKNRFNKKKKVYKLALGLSIDVTISVYLAFFAIFGLYIAFELMQESYELFRRIEQLFFSNYISLVLILIIRPLVASFTRPGVSFSSTELKMTTLLPYSNKQLWIFCAGERWVKMVVTCLILACLTAILTPFSLAFVFALAGTMVLMDILMTVPQWKLYQRKVAPKVFLIILVVGLGAAIRLATGVSELNQLWIWAIVAALLAVNGSLYKQTLRDVDWSKVVQANDLIIWNMWFINQMSQMKIKPPPSRGVLQRLLTSKKSRKPFVYQNSTAIYQRVWKRYFLEQREAVIRTVGSVMLTLVLLSFHGPWVFGVGIAVGVFLFVQMAASFFTDGFEERLIYVLPWDLKEWKTAFFIWVNRAGVLIGLVLAGLLVVFQQQLIWVPLQLLFYASVVNCYMHYQLDLRISVLSKARKTVPVSESLFILLALSVIVLSISFPVVSIFAVVVFVRNKLKGKDIHEEVFSHQAGSEKIKNQ